MKNKIKIATSTFLIALLLFSLNIYIQKKAVKYSPTRKVLVCINTQKGNKPINIANFILIDRSITSIPPGAIDSYSNIKGKTTKEEIQPNEVLTNAKIADGSLDSSLQPGMTKFSIAMTFIDNPLFAGTLRKGDVIKIIHTAVPSAKNLTPVTTEELKKAIVLDAIDNTGKHLTQNDTQLASEVILEGDSAEVPKITNDQYTGKFKFIQSN